MLVTMLAWIYITILCWMWGMLVLQGIKKISADKNYVLPGFSIICLTGFGGITVFASILSLFIPLGSWQLQIILFIPCFFFLLKKPERSFLKDIKQFLTGMHQGLQFLLIVCLLMTLVMSSWTIVHPDTLGYHAQTIQWIETYKAVPGLVHLHIRYGYQGLWFVACAIFGFKFTGIEAVTFINSTVLLWFFLFIVNRMKEGFSKTGIKLNGFLWTALLLISLWSYTQVRLTATSASPDFIATLLIWAIFYLIFINKRKSTTLWILTILLSFFAITIKLSCLPVLIIAGYAAIKLIQSKMLKQLSISLLIVFLILVPFFARNIITSGYLVFPFAFPDVVNVDWKYKKELTILGKKYITAYARTAGGDSKEEIEKIDAMKAREWLPVWWQNRSLADKTIIVLIIISFLLCLVRVKQIARSDQLTKIALLTAITGLTFWFIQAPDPRFGYGFIIAFIAISTGIISPEIAIYQTNKPGRVWLNLIFLISLVVAAYTAYRFIKFFSIQQIITPRSIEEIPFRPIQCNGITFNVPEIDKNCGKTIIPCVYDSCQTFQLRGTNIKNGFSAK